MIVLDTNVVSEMMKPERHPNVRAWMRAQAVHELATTTITLAEIGYGLARLPEGRRRFELETNLQAFVVRGLGPRVFSFNRAAAQVYGEMVVARERIGRPFEGFDGLIAAIEGAGCRDRDLRCCTDPAGGARGRAEVAGRLL